METEIIKTEDKDIVIERTFIDKKIDKKCIRLQKKDFDNEIKDLDKKLNQLYNINIKEDFKYLIDNEIGRFLTDKGRLEEEIKLLESDLLK